MDAKKQPPLQRVLRTFMAIVLAMGMSPIGAWASPGDGGGGGTAPQLVAGSISLQAQDDGDTITIGTDTRNSYEAPYCNYYNDS